MKVLVLLLVLVLALGWIFLRQRGRGSVDSTSRRPGPHATEMLACAHCGVHVPRGEALFDAAGNAYCGAEHRQAGPR